MEQSANNAAKRDAQRTFTKEGRAIGMGHIAIKTMNLLHLDLDSDRLLLLDPNPISMLPDLPSLDEEEEAFPEKWPSSVKKSFEV